MDGGFEEDMKHGIRYEWTEWRRQASGVLFGKRINGRFYKIVVRSAMLYGSECWAVEH